jgi:hypothetical protein
VILAVFHDIKVMTKVQFLPEVATVMAPLKTRHLQFERARIRNMSKIIMDL